MITENNLTFFKDVRFWVVLISLMTLMILPAISYQIN